MLATCSDNIYAALVNMKANTVIFFSLSTPKVQALVLVWLIEDTRLTTVLNLEILLETRRHAKNSLTLQYYTLKLKRTL